MKWMERLVAHSQSGCGWWKSAEADHSPATRVFRRIPQAGQTGIRLGSRGLAASLSAILPERCALCLRPDSGGYCSDCQTLLPWIDVACRRCGCYLDVPGLCGNCQQLVQRRPGRARELVVPFRYRNPIAHHIHELKYESRLWLAPALARQLALQVLSEPTPLPAVIVPVPLHRKRIATRGFNQATLIAHVVGRLLNVPVDTRFLVRTRDTSSQTDLDETARRRNMRGAFAVTTGGRYDSIAVIDDVVTSGATIDSVCDTLAMAGYRQSRVWAIAKT